jgi:pilus assembly protein CpaB
VRTRFVAIALAAVLGLLGVVAILAYVRQANERAVNGLKAETVMVATGAIRQGTSLMKARQEDLLGTEKVPESSLTKPAVQSVTGANEDMVMSAPVAKGQVLLQNMLGSASSVTTSGGFVIPSGMLAVAVDMCVPEAVANYVAPGAYVAVFDTLIQNAAQVQPSCSSEHQILSEGELTNTNAASTVLVLPKVEVLAVGQNPGSQGSNAAVTTDPSASSTSSSGDVLVTFAVDQADAERLILLQELGMPYLALLGSSSPAPAPAVNLFPSAP